MRTEWEGAYLDGRTAARQRADVRLMRTGLEVVTEHGTRLFWPYREIRQTQGFYAGEQVRLEHGGELSAAILVDDAAFLTHLHEAAHDAASRFHRPPRRGLRLALTVLATIAVVALVAGLYRWAIPALAALAAARVPVAWEERLGAVAVDELAPVARRCSDAAGARGLEALVAALSRPLAPSPYRFRVLVLDAPGVNAFAAPGGHVVLLRGLLERTDSPEELAAVLAHEMQHILRRHVTRALFEQASTGLLAVALSGDVSGAMAYGVEAARTLGTLRYSREHEDEADVEGARLLLAAGIDPRAMVRFLESLRRASGDPAGALGYLSTHPSPANRIARLRGLAATPPSNPVTLLEPSAWAAVRGMCGTTSGQR
jgi:predicted Zn-dependent protease